MSRVPVVVRVAAPAVERLDAVCARRGVSRSVAVREALGLWLDRFDPRAVSYTQRPGVIQPSSEPPVTEGSSSWRDEGFDPWGESAAGLSVAADPEPETEAAPVANWGLDRYGRRVWTGPVDADGNPVGDDAA